MKINKNLNDSLYISFSKVAKILKVKPHVLLYWEKKIPQLKPYRIANRKFYRKEQLSLLLQTKNLLDEGYSLEGIKNFFLKKRTQSTSSQVYSQKDLKQIIKEVLEELKNIYQKL